ncbi:hypothetical protein BVRB_024570, partial [Beta vulgaris subsp. vulgaris]
KRTPSLPVSPTTSRKPSPLRRGPSLSSQGHKREESLNRVFVSSLETELKLLQRTSSLLKEQLCVAPPIFTIDSAAKSSIDADSLLYGPGPDIGLQPSSGSFRDTDQSCPAEPHSTLSPFLHAADLLQPQSSAPVHQIPEGHSCKLDHSASVDIPQIELNSPVTSRSESRPGPVDRSRDDSSHPALGAHSTRNDESMISDWDQSSEKLLSKYLPDSSKINEPKLDLSQTCTPASVTVARADITMSKIDMESFQKQDSSNLEKANPADDLSFNEFDGIQKRRRFRL